MAGEVLPEDQANPNFQAGNSSENFFQKIWANPQYRIFALVGAGVLLVILIVSTLMISQGSNENRGKLVPLVQELDQARAFEIVAKLKSVNIEAKINVSEKPGEYIIRVYEKAIESAYLALSRTNLLEEDDYGLFDENDWAASDYDKRIKLIRAINGDLSRIISRMDGLRSAIVRVHVPEQELFTELQAPTTATIQIELENDAEELSKSQVKSILNVLRGYVPKLEVEHISIVDTQGRNYSTFKDDDEADTDDYIEEVEKFNKIISNRIQKYLDTILGASEYTVSVSASLSRERVEKQRIEYSEGAVGARQVGTEVLKTGSATFGDEKAGPGLPGGKDYAQSSTNETMLPSYESQNISLLPGRVTDVTVALAVDKSVPAMMSLKQLQESVAAIIGPNIKTENVVITVLDLHSKDELSGLSTDSTKSNFYTNIFKSKTWNTFTKVLSVLAVIVLLIIAGVLGLNFLTAMASKNIESETDESFGKEFDEVLNEDEYSEEDFDEDFGEQRALEQQEALLQEMLNQGSNSYAAKKGDPVSHSNKSGDQNQEFESLLNNFQSVAQNKPDLLAKKIQVWLNE
jgi:flagellar M-ring protein FliF